MHLTNHFLGDKKICGIVLAACLVLMTMASRVCVLAPCRFYVALSFIDRSYHILRDHILPVWGKSYDLLLPSFSGIIHNPGISGNV